MNIKSAEINALTDAVAHARIVKDKPEEGRWYSYEGIQCLKNGQKHTPHSKHTDSYKNTENIAYFFQTITLTFPINIITTSTSKSYYNALVL